MSDKDVFADLFSPKKKDLSKLSLAERQKLTNGNGVAGNNSWNGLDFLATVSSSNSKASSSSSFLPATTGSVLNHESSNQSNISLLSEGKNVYESSSFDDIFGLSDSKNTNSVNSKQENLHSISAKPTSNQSQDIDSLFAVFDNPAPAPIHKSHSNVSDSQSVTGEYNLSALPVKKTHSNSSATRRKLPVYDNIPSRPSRFGSSRQNSKNVHKLFDEIAKPAPEDLNQMVNEISSELFSSATSIFNKGKKALNKNIEKYQAQKKAELNGKPAWMYQQAKYRRQDHEDGDVIDFDGTVLKQNVDVDNDMLRESNVRFSREKQSDLKNSPNNVQKTVSKNIQQSNVSQSVKNTQQSNISQSVKKIPQSLKNNQTTTNDNNTLLNIFDDLTLQDRASAVSATYNEPNVDKSQLMRFNQYRTLGSTFFKEGNFTSALLNYQDAIKVLPRGHSLQILGYSNLTTTYVKLGDTKNALNTINDALEMIKQTNRTFDEPVEGGKLIKEFWIKLMTKKAETLESLERYPEALDAWKLVLENGGANKAAIDAKRRCMEAINPQKHKAVPVKTKPPSRSQASNEAIQRIKASHAKAESFEQEKFMLHDKVQAKIDQWKHGKEDNIRALLASMDQVLWPAANWKQVSLTDLVLDKKVKVYYMKAVAKTHPDKIAQNATTEQQLIAQSVFVTLNKAWDTFKKQNNMN